MSIVIFSVYIEVEPLPDVSVETELLFGEIQGGGANGGKITNGSEAVKEVCNGEAVVEGVASSRELEWWKEKETKGQEPKFQTCKELDQAGMNG
ncbi:hypothetical protein PIB30_045016 [Stylosanthes scabra]|uniref:Uncharacterized protein n=1 Tax=Stylosanthes scabra TaxID=79078 RepID=A0ABU6ZER0_9FABA|nr:hypothetical protein [Stylosanthes scabra]